MGESRSLYVILSANATNYRQVLNAAARETRDFGSDVQDMGRDVDRAGNEIDKMSGRLRLALDALKLVGPAAVPIGAVAVPAIAGLANGLAFAAVSGGAAVLAFQGVGDSLKALNKAQLEPTAANLAAARKELEDLHPAAAGFVLELDRMAPAWASIQKASAAGFFPGATDGLHELEEVIPQWRGLMQEVADTTGDLLAEGAEGLTSDRAREFYTFLEREARPTLTNLFATTSNLASGMASLWQGMGPLNDDFSNWLLGVSEGFDRWSQEVDDTEGFEEFMEYVRTTGPIVQDFLVGTADALLEIAEAAAPLGGPVLEGLTAVVETIGAIADSPVGTPIVTAALAVTALNRGLAVTAALMTKAGMGGGAAVAATRGGVMAAMSTHATKAQAGVRGLTGDLRSMSREYERAGRGQSILLSGMSNTTAAAQRTRTALAGASKAAAGIAGVALLATGAADNMGAANTATLALTGAMIGGPMGAVAGGIIGAFADAKASTTDYSSALDRLATSSRNASTSFEQLTQNGSKAFTDMQAAWDDGGNITGVGDALQMSLSGLGAVFDKATGNDTEFAKLQDRIKGTQQEWGNLTGILAKVAKAQGDVVRSGTNLDAEALGFDTGMGPQTLGWLGNLEDMGRVATSIEPAMREIGVTWEDMFKADGADKARIVEDLNEQLSYMDSNTGQIDAVGDALADLDNNLLSTTESATGFAQALETLLNPKLDLSAQKDAWTAALRSLNEDLSANNKTLKGNSDAALQNREAIRERVEQMQATLTAEAAAGASSEELARSMERQRAALIRTAVQSGLNRRELRAYLNTLGLTPAMVRTVMEAAGVDVAAEKARRLKDAYDALPPSVRAKISAEGIPRTQAQVDALVEKYKLTEKQRKALLTLIDNASPKLRTIGQLLASINSKSVTVTTTHIDIRRPGKIGGGQGQSHVPRADGALYSGRVQAFADGGYAASGAYHARESQIVPGGANILWGEPETGWEAYISGKPSQRERNVRILQETARRLGVEVAANGATRGREYVTGARGRGAVVVQRGAGLPDRVQLVVEGRSFTAYVRAQASDVARGHADSAADTDASHGRMSWP